MFGSVRRLVGVSSSCVAFVPALCASSKSISSFNYGITYSVVSYRPLVVHSQLFSSQVEEFSRSPDETQNPTSSEQESDKKMDEDWLKLLKPLVKAKKSQKVCELLSQMESAGFVPSVSNLYEYSTLYNHLLFNLFKKDITSALQLFEKLKSLHQLNTIAWSITIDHLSKAKRYDQAIAQWNQMITRGGKPNDITAIAVLSAVIARKNTKLARTVTKEIERLQIPQTIKLQSQIFHTFFACGFTAKALLLFEKMKVNDQLDTVSWNLAIQELTKANKPARALAQWKEMISTSNTSAKPNERTAIAVLSAVSVIGDPKEAFQVIEEINQLKIPHSTLLRNQFLRVLFKCDSSKALKMFADMRLEKQLTAVSWNIGIDELGKAGKIQEATALFKEMENEKYHIDDRTIMAMLGAYKTAKMIPKAIELFDTMQTRYKVKPNKFHVNCILSIFRASGMQSELERYTKEHRAILAQRK